MKKCPKKFYMSCFTDRNLKSHPYFFFFLHCNKRHKMKWEHRVRKAELSQSKVYTLLEFEFFIYKNKLDLSFISLGRLQFSDFFVYSSYIHMIFSISFYCILNSRNLANPLFRKFLSKILIHNMAKHN